MNTGVEKAFAFDGCFDRIPPKTNPAAAAEAQQKIEARKAKERKSQRTEQQRRRRATRTSQMAFRCTPELHKAAMAYAKSLNISLADLVENLLLAEFKRKKFKSEETGE